MSRAPYNMRFDVYESMGVSNFFPLVAQALNVAGRVVPQVPIVQQDLLQSEAVSWLTTDYSFISSGRLNIAYPYMLTENVYAATGLSIPSGSGLTHWPVRGERVVAPPGSPYFRWQLVPALLPQGPVTPSTSSATAPDMPLYVQHSVAAADGGVQWLKTAPAFCTWIQVFGVLSSPGPGNTFVVWLLPNAGGNTVIRSFVTSGFFNFKVACPDVAAVGFQLTSASGQSSSVVFTITPGF